MGLLARSLEEAGVPTTTATSARDITASVKPPRAVFVNFPLGHTTGAPFDRELQRGIVKAALNALAEVQQGGTIIDLPYVWPPDPQWDTKPWP